MPRAYADGDWMKMSQALVDIGNAALLHANAKDADGRFDLGGEIDEACETCHRLYAYEDAPRRKR